MGKTLGKLALVFGIIGLLFWIALVFAIMGLVVPILMLSLVLSIILSIPSSILAIIFGAIGIKKDDSSSLAITGLVLGSIAIIAWIFRLLWGPFPGLF